MSLKRADHARRARVQCLLCPYAGTRASNMPRHYEEVHGYDRSAAVAGGEEAGGGDGAVAADPDGALCPECGEHFASRHGQIRHLLRAHTRSTGEQCLYCRHRYHDLEGHIDDRHQVRTWEHLFLPIIF